MKNNFLGILCKVYKILSPLVCMVNISGEYTKLAVDLEFYVENFIPKENKNFMDDVNRISIFDSENIKLIVNAYKNNLLEDELSYLGRHDKYFESLYVKEAVKDFFHKNEIFRLGYLD